MRSVLLVDAQTQFRGALGRLFTSAGWQVVGETADGSEAVELAQRLKPDLVLMESRLPAMNGLEATRLIKQADASAKVVILTVSGEENDLFEALQIGANGYVLKNMRPELFLELLERVFLGEMAITPAVAAKVPDEFLRLTRHPKRSVPAAPSLTPREKDILQLVARSASNRDIATTLNIAESTVKSYLHHIMVKLHVNSRGQAAAWAMRGGIIPPEDAG